MIAQSDIAERCDPGRSIVVLESNTGYTQLHQMLLRAHDRAKISAEEAQRVLKDLVFSAWSAGQCESRADTLKMVSLVDFFLPYFPLERRHVAELFRMRLEERQRQLRKRERCDLTWAQDVVAFLTNRVRALFWAFLCNVQAGWCVYLRWLADAHCPCRTLSGSRMSHRTMCELAEIGHDKVQTEQVR